MVSKQTNKQTNKKLYWTKAIGTEIVINLSDTNGTNGRIDWVLVS